jgi:hypothetical protein
MEACGYVARTLASRLRNGPTASEGTRSSRERLLGQKPGVPWNPPILPRSGGGAVVQIELFRSYHLHEQIYVVSSLTPRARRIPLWHRCSTSFFDDADPKGRDFREARPNPQCGRSVPWSIEPVKTTRIPARVMFFQPSSQRVASSHERDEGFCLFLLRRGGFTMRTHMTRFT